MVKRTICMMLALGTLIFAMSAGAQKPMSSYIIINVPSRTLEYYADSELIKVYPVAVGKPSTPTPLGNYYVTDMQVDPWWYPPGQNYFVPSGSFNPLGYRWIGFLPTYGIHGTNMPWSIGGAASNGCIRMYETDVEELFELVDLFTPVTVTYDRIKTKVDSEGRVTMGVYPDIYGYGTVTVADAKQQLAQMGLDGFVAENTLRTIISEESGSEVVLAKVHGLEVNGIKLKKHIIASDGSLYGPVMEVAAAGSTSVVWDENNNRIIGKCYSVPGVLIGSTHYVTLNNLALLFGGTQTWSKTDNCLQYQLPAIKYEGKTISTDIQIFSSIRGVAAIPLAKAAGLNVTWDVNEQVIRMGGFRRLPAKIVNDEPYIELGNLAEYFNIRSNWDSDTLVCNLTYPLHPLDYSMYIDQMADFF